MSVFKLLTTFLLSYPLAGLLKRVPDARPDYKNLFIVGVSLFYLVGLFDLWVGIRTLLISSTGAYLIAANIRGPYMPWIGFVFLMGHMSISHILRQYRATPEVVDISGAQMVLVMKLSAFCWNVHDGQLPQDGLSDFQRDRAIRELPGLLDYAGYVLFFPALLAGPSFDYAEYRRWIDTSLFNVPAGTDPSKHPPTRKKRRIPRSGTPATMKLVSGLLWILAFIKLSSMYGPDRLASDEYRRSSFLYRVLLLHVFGIVARTKYYGVWALTEGACILSGLGYKGVDPKTGRVQWDRLVNVRPWAVETAQNSRAYLENWNINTNHWLRNYIYLRVTPKGKKPGFQASMATFVTSAFWHGFYPGYYLTFVLASLLQTVAKSNNDPKRSFAAQVLIGARTDFRRYMRPLFLTPTGDPSSYKPFYDVVSVLCTELAFSFAVAPFVLLEFSTSIGVWSSVYFYAPAGTILSMVFFASPAKRHLVKLQERRLGEAAAVAAAAKGENLTQSDARATTTRQPQVASPPIMGVPLDPGQDLDEMIGEVSEQVRMRRRTGSIVRAQEKGSVGSEL
ncbi:MAG: lysophospholipid acyltransferase [Lichina confinis]|nr:MAG: lysophospholipid acyltransferase [Lichina confinis]